jgi:hypothetical protein
MTDVMLLALPVPTLMSLQTPLQTKLRLYTLCALGLFIVAITVIRLPINALNASVQANRTTWASTELLAAAIAANAPILYGAINHWRRRSKNGSYAYAYGHGSCPGNTRTVGNHSKSQQAPHNDEEGPILCQTSVSSGFVTRNCDDGIIMKTIEASCDRTDRVNAGDSGVLG